jgi:hypothetical protein
MKKYMKKNKHTNKKTSRKNRRRTKRMRGGKFLGNMFGNLFAKDEGNKYYYKTNIKVKDKEYEINYFTPNNFLLVKTTDQIKTPKFFLYLDKNTNTPANIIMKIDKYVVNSIVKIKNNWYVITRTLENITNFNIKSGYYKINPGILSNDNEKLYITENKYNYKIEENSVILNESTYNPVKDTDDALGILVNFEIQQNVKAGVKEEAGFIGLVAIGDDVL